MDKEEEIIRREIEEKIKEFYRLRRAKERFVPGKSRVLYASAVYDHLEVTSMLNAILDGWFGVGIKAEEMENKLSGFLGVSGTILTNSGSSANLLGISTLCSPMLEDHDPLRLGDEVITSATTFSTTVNPLFQNGLVPVFVDSKRQTFNMDPEYLHDSLSRKSRAILVPHMVGIPNEMETLQDFADDHDLYLIEDTCDALGSKYDGKCLGSFGILSTFSFYAAHHISMGEGGAISSREEEILETARSIRDWGRALNIKSESNKLRGLELPDDYDLRYVYVTMGYNLKPTEIQAAKGTVQMDKLEGFIEARRKNYDMLYSALGDYTDVFQFAEPPKKSKVSWFSFPITIRENAPFTRSELVDHLAKHGIDSRAMLAGNIVRHPAYQGKKYRTAGRLENSDYILRNSFFVGLHPGLHREEIQYVIDVFVMFLRKFAKLHR